MTVQSKSTRQNRLRLVLAGMDKHLSSVTSLTLGGNPVAVSDLKTQLQGDINASDASAQAKAAWRTQVQAERDSHAKVNPTLRLFKYYVTSQFGDTQNATQTLGDFGFSPRKTAVKTVATKADAVAKTKATRAARHTMGSKQKAQVKGVTIPATEPSPVQGDLDAANATTASSTTSGSAAPSATPSAAVTAAPVPVAPSKSA